MLFPIICGATMVEFRLIIPLNPFGILSLGVGDKTKEMKIYFHFICFVVCQSSCAINYKHNNYENYMLEKHMLIGVFTNGLLHKMYRVSRDFM